MAFTVCNKNVCYSQSNMDTRLSKPSKIWDAINLSLLEDLADISDFETINTDRIEEELQGINKEWTYYKYGEFKKGEIVFAKINEQLTLRVNAEKGTSSYFYTNGGAYRAIYKQLMKTNRLKILKSEKNENYNREFWETSKHRIMMEELKEKGKSFAYKILLVKNSSVSSSQKKIGGSSNQLSGINTPPKITNLDNLENQDQSPDFIGGNEAYHAFLEKELVYPTIPNRNRSISSVRVLAEFTVESDGKLSDFNYTVDFEILGEYTKDEYEEIENSYSNYYKIAVRDFLLKMPRWKPAQNGLEKISTKWALPIFFRYTDAIEQKKEEPTTFASVEKAAEYVGGYEAMNKFINKNLVLPKSNSTSNEETHLRIDVNLIIEKDGTVSEVKIKNKSSETEKYESCIVHCFQKMPKWNPAEQNGKPIRMLVNTPITISTTN